MALAQNTSSQLSAADSTADTIMDHQLQLLRKDIRSIKKQLIAENLTLTDSEATKFWQLYEQYSAETERINDTRTAIIKEYSEDYGTLTDDQGRQSHSPLAGYGHRTNKNCVSSTCRSFERSCPERKQRPFFSVRPPHQHDDRSAAYIATSPGPRSGLNFLLRGAMSAIKKQTEPIAFCVKDL